MSTTKGQILQIGVLKYLFFFFFYDKTVEKPKEILFTNRKDTNLYLAVNVR